MKHLQSSTDVFEQIAGAVAEKHLAQIKIITAKLGARPPFDQLMTQLKEVEHELTREGVEYIESQKQSPDCNVEVVTNQLHTIIKATIEQFVKQL